MGDFLAREDQLRSIASKAGVEETLDVVQDVMLKAVVAGRRTEVLDPVRFLARVARNTVIDRLRVRKRQVQLFDGEASEDIVDPLANPERALMASERLRLALEIIDGMPAKRRQVFLMQRIDEHSYAEISRRLGINIKTVEKHMALAMFQLAREMNGR